MVRATLELPPVRGRLARRANDAWARGGRVLFVCHGNICRSPFAERLVTAGSGSWEQVASAGSFPRGGRPAPEDAVLVATTFGIDLGPHRSHVLCAADVASADAVFVFDVRNHLTMARRFPAAWGKVHLLGALSAGPLEIPDPYGRGPERFEAVYRRIVGAVGVTDP